jgi:hypothetical protein
LTKYQHLLSAALPNPSLNRTRCGRWRTIRGDAAQQSSLSEATVQQWLDAARSLAPAFGMEAPVGQRGHSSLAVPAPEPDLHRATAAALGDLETRLGTAAHEHRSLIGEALQIAATRFNLRRHDVCFRGEREEKAARRFLKALDVMGLLPSKVRLTVRRASAENTKLPHWFRSARVRDLAVKRLPSPGTSDGQAKAYARWVGIQLCVSEGEAVGHASRIGLFLACIAYAPSHGNEQFGAGEPPPS